MLIAIVVINIGLLAILLALTSGVTTLRRSAETSTASAVADHQLERYRAVAFTSIYLDTAALAATDSTYQADAAYSASQVSQACGTLTAVCTPTQTVTGPDGRSYRVDTYIVWTTPTRRHRCRSRSPSSFASPARPRRSPASSPPPAPTSRASQAPSSALPIRRFVWRAFAYSAINALGAESAGQITAPDVDAARELLRQKGLRPVSLVGGRRGRRGRQAAQEARQAALAAGLLAAVRDDDRRGPERRRGARHPRAADRRQGARRCHQGGALGRRGRDAPLAGDGAASRTPSIASTSR